MMAKQDTAQSQATGADNPFAPLLELQKAGFGNMMGMNSAWLESLGEMGAEFMQFLAERVREDVKTQHQILHCKDVSEMQEIQARFVQKAIDQYQAETGKLVQMGMSALKPDDSKNS